MFGIFFKNELGVASLGVSVTTMEDVFLKVGELGGAIPSGGSRTSVLEESEGQVVAGNNDSTDNHADNNCEHRSASRPAIANGAVEVPNQIQGDFFFILIYVNIKQLI